MGIDKADEAWEDTERRVRGLAGLPGFGELVTMCEQLEKVWQNLPSHLIDAPRPVARVCVKVYHNDTQLCHAIIATTIATAIAILLQTTTNRTATMSAT